MIGGIVDNRIQVQPIVFGQPGNLTGAAWVKDIF